MFTGLARPYLKKNKPQNVIVTKLVFRYMGKSAMIVKKSSCSVHVIRVKVHFQKKKLKV